MNLIYRNVIILVLAVFATFGLTACSTWDKLDRTEKGAIIGTGGGAAVGGLAGGSKGAVLGGVAGGVAGGVIGHNQDDDKD